MPTVYSPPVPTHIALATYTVPSGGAASVTFSSIPATYRDLNLVIAGSGEAAFLIYLRFNGDSGSSYFGVQMSGRATNGAISYTSGVGEAQAYVLQNAAQSSTQLNMVANIMDYSATDKHKTMISKCSAVDNVGGGQMVQTNVNRWANTNAITSILATAQLADFAEGTVLSLYGIEA